MKKSLLCLIAILMVFSMFGCAKERALPSDYVDIPPETAIQKTSEELDFLEMHNVILEEMMESNLPFFFIKKGCLDISGSNDPKEIVITMDCMDGTTKQDVDLVVSYLLGSIGLNASEQNFKYKRPTEVMDGDVEGTFVTYDDFGTVFNEYDIVLKITLEEKEYIYDTVFPAGQEIPINPRYWRGD